VRGHWASKTIALAIRRRSEKDNVEFRKGHWDENFSDFGESLSCSSRKQPSVESKQRD